MSEYDLGQYDVDRSDLDTILDNGTLTGASSKYVRQARPSDLTRPCFRVTSASVAELLSMSSNLSAIQCGQAEQESHRSCACGTGVCWR